MKSYCTSQKSPHATSLLVTDCRINSMARQHILNNILTFAFVWITHQTLILYVKNAIAITFQILHIEGYSCSSFFLQFIKKFWNLKELGSDSTKFLIF